MRRRTAQFEKIAGDIDGHQLIHDYFKESHRILKDNTHIYSFCSWHHVDFFKQEFEKWFDLKNILIWSKGGGGIGDLDGSWLVNYELILFGHKGRRGLNKSAAATRTTSILEVPKVQPSTMVHPTEKPIELIERLIRASSNEGEIIFEGFMGCGSHGMAATRNNRSFIGCELDTNYYNIAKERIESASSTLDQFFV